MAFLPTMMRPVTAAFPRGAAHGNGEDLDCSVTSRRESIERLQFLAAELTQGRKEMRRYDMPAFGCKCGRHISVWLRAIG
ncbi:MAG: hypothetical protein ACLPTZ_30275 [Beijerinckiaceae bacterium]